MQQLRRRPPPFARQEPRGVLLVDRTRPLARSADTKIALMSGNRQRQCLRGVAGGDDDVELGAAMALADMAGAVAAAPPPPQAERSSGAHGDGDYGEEEEASTRLSLELGKVGVQGAAAASSACSSAGQQHKQVLPAVAAPGAGYGARPRNSALTEAEKEAKRLRRVLANRESARQTILRRQAIRDELARKVADLASQNESMKKEKEAVMQEYLALQETNKQLREQARSFSLF
ncbi:bZIP transcription factor 68-like [Brachypodium distachyon]|uniref:bZIP transcription factor 68-like n=1 Tax=Brachypodium distachyon TaxID=15368 RepID=UPI000D0D5F48|nr:bZIP transcription factor 68-like [Brachypodium distachyon]|eukprot:XP_024310433.1 bZIP transcription factor 68-like [Brachypodium distachyon]